MTTPSESKVGERLDRRLLLLQLGLNEILNRNDPHDLPVLVQEGQMPDVLHQHLRHASRDGLAGRCRDEIGALRRDFFDASFRQGRGCIWT